MGKDRGCNIMKEACKSLRGTMRKMPDNQGNPDAVIITGIGLQGAETRKGRILAAAVHPDVLKPLERRRLQAFLQEGRYFFMIDEIVIHVQANPLCE